MLKRFLSLLMGMALVASSAAAAAAQPASPEADPAVAVEDHLAWILDVFDSGGADVTVDDIERRFSEMFLGQVPADDLVVTLQQFATMFGTLELVEMQQDTAANEVVGVYETASGERLMLSLAVNPESGLIDGFFVTPASPEPEASPAATPDATPVASPAAPVVVDDADAQIAAYQERIEGITRIGEQARDAVQEIDGEALDAMSSDELRDVLGTTSLDTVLHQYTERQVQMAFPEADIVFFGQLQDDQIAGLMVQAGTPYVYNLTAEEPQEGELPEGQWTGTLQDFGLDVIVTFSADGDTRDATLTIPMQGVEDAPMSDVTYMEERPIGEVVDQHAVSFDGATGNYTVDFAWGDHLLRMAAAVDPEAGQLIGLQIIPAVPTVEQEGAPVSETDWRLPLEGTWWVLWGGDNALRNYHVSAPSQFHAYDMVIWKDGATWHGDGVSNADYWAWGQRVNAPAAGEVVVAHDGEEDLEPGTSFADRAQLDSPVGNHVMIQTAEREFVVLAHLQQGSVAVEVGDQVEAGDLLGLVGNSGNSTEPHLHLHAQDSQDVLDYSSAGIEIRFAEIEIDGEVTEDAVPVQGDFVSPVE